MNKIKAILTFALIIWPMVSGAVSVKSAAGKLSDAIGGNHDINELSIEGSLDASDFDYINNNLHGLSKLDLSKARIEAYSGDRVLSGLTSYAADELPAYSLAGMAVEEVVLPVGLLTIGEGALSATKIVSIDLPETLTAITDYAFAGCGQLKSISAPKSLKSVGTGAFAGCTALESADFQQSAVQVSSRMFDGCGSLSSVDLPKNLTAIGESAFKATRSLAALEFPESLKEIGKSAFYGSGLASADLSACRNLASIGDFAFAECGKLESVRLGGIAALGSGVFFDDALLTEFILPESVTVIPEFTFKGGVSLQADDILHDNITEIGDYALTGWTQVSELKLPTSLSYIGDNAMESMTGLNEVTATGLDVVPELGEDVWKNVEQADVILYVDEADAESYRSADQWNRFNVTVKTIDSAEQTEIDAIESGIEYKFRDHKLILESKNADIVSIEIFDLAGRCRYRRSASSQVVEIATTGFLDDTIVILVALSDGSNIGLKATF